MFIRTNPAGLPLHAFDSAVGNFHPIVWIISILLVTALLDIVLQPRHGLDVLKIVAPQSDDVDVALPREGSAQEDLWKALQDLADSGPCSIHRRISVADDGTIVTSQGALADLTGLSKTAVNRSLKALRLEGRIDLQPTVHGTRIRVLGGERCGTGQETPIGTPGNAIERRERTGPDRS